MMSQPQPPPSPQHSRTNLADMKMQLVKRIGQQRANRYFNCLNGLLSHKLSKSEFIKLCLLILGRENLPLHNQLICAILRNACQAKTPPSAYYGRDNNNSGGVMLQNFSQKDDGLNSSQFPSSAPQIWSNGNVSPASPRKFQSGVQNQRSKDRPSPLGPNGRAEVPSTQQSLLSYDEPVLRGNSDTNLCGFKRQVQHQQIEGAEQQGKRLRNEQDSSCNNRVVELHPMDDSEDPAHKIDFESTRGPLKAPLGIPFCSRNISGPLKFSHLAAKVSSSDCSSVADLGELSHTELLKKRMEKIAEAQGLTGVTMDCANLLNNGIDTYLKQLISSSLELTGARTGHKTMKPSVSKLKPYDLPTNGTWFANQIQVQNGGGRSEGMQEVKTNCFVTLQDFKVAMELNPKQLGQDWPLLLERICTRSFEE